MSDPIFGDVIFTYTRADALSDGALWPVPEQLAKEAGYVVPVVLSAHLEERLEVPEEWQPYQDFTGRLWDVLWMAHIAIKTSKPGDNPLPFKVIVNSNLNGKPETLDLLASFDGEAITLYFPEDD